MTSPEYIDLLVKGLVAFTIPIGWVIIFYPLIKKSKKPWHLLVITASMLSFLTLVLKEVMDKENPAFDSLVTYALGIFFGIAGISLLFNIKSKWLEALPKSDILPRKHKIRRKIHMRYVFQVAILAEERGKEFYNSLAEKTPNADTKNLCLRLARAEDAHRQLFQNILYQWLPLSADKEVLNALMREFSAMGLFLNPPPDIEELDMVKYAISQEKTMADLYLSFEKAFPAAWKRMHIQTLVMAERSHASELMSAYPQLIEGAA